MLGLLGLTSEQRRQLRDEIAATLPERELIPIRAHLISLTDRVLETPWAYPALLDTHACRDLHRKFNDLAGHADVIASTGADPVTQYPVGPVLTALFKSLGAVIGFGINWTQWLSGKTKDYYAFYANGSPTSSPCAAYRPARCDRDGNVSRASITPRNSLRCRRGCRSSSRVHNRLEVAAPLWRERPSLPEHCQCRLRLPLDQHGRSATQFGATHPDLGVANTRRATRDAATGSERDHDVGLIVT